MRLSEIEIQPLGGHASVAPDYAAVIANVLKQKGIDITASAAAGGTGAAGAAAVAAAPIAGVAGGIVGGVALTVGVCAAIGALKELGQDAVAVCDEGVRRLAQVTLLEENSGQFPGRIERKSRNDGRDSRPERCSEDLPP